jgi:hypothetical protein
MGKASKNFLVQEFVPQKIFEKYGDASLWFYGDASLWFIDPKIVSLAQLIRDYFGKSMTINNWHSGGNFNYRGFRNDSFYYQWDADISAYKSKRKGKLSQHRMGRAIDFNISGITADEIRAEIMKNESMWIEAGVTTMEHEAYSKTWCHLDIRYTGKDKIFIVKP